MHPSISNYIGQSIFRICLKHIQNTRLFLLCCIVLAALNCSFKWAQAVLKVLSVHVKDIAPLDGISFSVHMWKNFLRQARFCLKMKDYVCVSHEKH